MTQNEHLPPVLSSAEQQVCFQSPFYLFSPSTTCLSHQLPHQSTCHLPHPSLHQTGPRSMLRYISHFLRTLSDDTMMMMMMIMPLNEVLNTVHFEGTIYSKLDNQRITVQFPAGARDFLFSKRCRLGLGPTQTSIQCGLRVSFSGGKAIRA